MSISDTERLDFLQNMLGSYTGNVICRWSTLRRGWRLHETSLEGGVKDVRMAIDNFLMKNGKIKREVNHE